MDPTKNTDPESAKLEKASAESVDAEVEEDKPLDASSSASPSEQQQPAPTDDKNPAATTAADKVKNKPFLMVSPLDFRFG